MGNTAWSMYNFRFDVIKALLAEDCDITILAPDDEWSKKFKEMNIKFLPIEMDNKGTSPFKDIHLCWRLFKIYRKFKPDLIFHYTIKPNIYGSIAARICGIKSIAFVTGAGNVFIKHNYITTIVKGLLRVALQFPKEVWFLNGDDKDLFLSYHLIRTAQCKILPSEGINTLQFKNNYNKDEKDNITFLFLGRLLWDKGVGEYVKAAQAIKLKYKNINFQILGFLDALNPSAISKSEIDTWVNMGIVDYLGSRDDVSEIISHSDCVVLPTYYREGVPRSLLEASSLGIPVIATDAPGCRDVVEDQITGYLCQPKDVEDLRDKMQKIILMDRDDRLKMGRNGRERVERMFDINLVIQEYKKVINI